VQGNDDAPGSASNASPSPSMRLRLRPISAVVSGKNGWEQQPHPQDDGPSCVSVGRSFGLSTTTGARGDAVSYVLYTDPTPASSSPSSAQSTSSSSPSLSSSIPPTRILGVVKVVKSHTVFRQELAALTLMRRVLPSPGPSTSTAHYPELLGAAWAKIPTTIPDASSAHSSGFVRAYSVSSMGSSNAGSIVSRNSKDDDGLGEYCVGGVVLMACAPGVPLSEIFVRVGACSNESVEGAGGKHARQRWMDELKRGITSAADALAELHLASAAPHQIQPPQPSSSSTQSSVPSSSQPSSSCPEATRYFIHTLGEQMRDMLGKLDLDSYKDTVAKWKVDTNRIREVVTRMEQEAEREPGVPCLIHGDAHAGNMLWDASTQRLTLIDLPTMLHATSVQRDQTSDSGSDDALLASSSANRGVFRIRPPASIPTDAVQAAVSAPVSTNSSSSAPSSTRPPPYPGFISAACMPLPPSSSSPSSSFVLHGSGLASRDVCHFERKIESHGLRRGMSVEEVNEVATTFRRRYRRKIEGGMNNHTDEGGDSERHHDNANHQRQENGQADTSSSSISPSSCPSLLTAASDQLCSLRSLLGEVTQLVKYEPSGLNQRIFDQLEELLSRVQD